MSVYKALNEDLRTKDFGDVRLVDAYMAGCILDFVDLTDRDMRGINLADASIVDGDLSGSDLTAAKLSGVKAARVRLVESTLTRATSTGGTFNEANFGRADLTDAYFERCSLVRADLDRADLDNARFVNCDLTGASMDDCAMLRTPSFRGSDLTGVKLSWDNSGLVLADRWEHGTAHPRPRPVAVWVDGETVVISLDDTTVIGTRREALQAAIAWAGDSGDAYAVRDETIARVRSALEQA